jgi:hypothetical protein
MINELKASCDKQLGVATKINKNVFPIPHIKMRHIICTKNFFFRIFIIFRQFKIEVQHLEVFAYGTHRDSLMFTTTKDIPMNYSHLSTTERLALYQYRTIDALTMEEIAYRPMKPALDLNDKGLAALPQAIF